MGKHKKQQKKAKPSLPASHVDHGTGATRKRLRSDPVDEYAAARRNSDDKLAGEKESAAREIRRVYNMVTAGLWARAVDMHGIRGLSEGAPEWLAMAHRDRYKPWADEMGRTHGLAMVMDWLIDEQSFAQIDRDRRQRNGTASNVIDCALLRYAQIAGWVGHVTRAA